MRTKIERVPVGHGNGRRVIYDLIQNGDAGGRNPLHQLSYFNPVYAGAQIGGAREGHGHLHKGMWETYIILSGECCMSLHDLLDGDVVHQKINVIPGASPIRVIIPPNVVHRLSAITDTLLFIAATGPQTQGDTFEAKFPEPV